MNQSTMRMGGRAIWHKDKGEFVAVVTVSWADGELQPVSATFSDVSRIAALHCAFMEAERLAELAER